MDSSDLQVTHHTQRLIEEFEQYKAGFEVPPLAFEMDQYDFEDKSQYWVRGKYRDGTVTEATMLYEIIFDNPMESG